MHDDIELARTAAIKFLKGLPEAQDITLVDFDTEVRIARYGLQDFPRLVERIRARKPEGLTALYDALGIYLDGADELDGRKVLVIYTDGGDTRSAVTFADRSSMLKMADVTVYAVGFLEHQSTLAPLAAEDAADADGRNHRRPGVLSRLDPEPHGHLRQGRRADPRAVQPGVHVDETPGRTAPGASSRCAWSGRTCRRSGSAPARATSPRSSSPPVPASSGQ